MRVFRITLKKWSDKLQASGFSGRWNSKGKFVIYTSNSRALASLENLAHRSGEGLNALFSTIMIEIPENLKIKKVKPNDLSQNWYKYENYSECQEIGDRWLEEDEYCVLKVPSAIIKMESNYLINPNHNEFKKIKITTTEIFDFDPRFKK